MRQEFSWTSGVIYGMSRKAVHKHFLVRPRIYSAWYFRRQCQRQKRTNFSAVT